MKKIGFIGEGDCETIFLNSVKFNELLNNFQLESVGVFNAEGIANLTSYQNRVDSFIKILTDKGADKIIIVVDKDDENCLKDYKSIFHKYSEKQVLIIAVKAIESWYLADTKTLSAILRTNFYCEFPERIENPFQFIKQEFIKNLSRGIEKKTLSKKMIRNGFTLEQCVLHNNSRSSQYFLRKLESLGE